MAISRALSVKGYKVTVLERHTRAVGASVRNFGMVWPIGQPEGKLCQRAIRSRNIWKECCQEAGIWYSHNGSMHVAYHADEWQVLQEFKASVKERKGSDC